LILIELLLSGLSARAQLVSDFSTKEFVGRIGKDRYYTPANQILTPAGLQVELPRLDH